MSQLKQNSYRGGHQSKQRRSLKNLNEPNNFYSTTQAVYSSKKSSCKYNENENTAPQKQQFYKTLGNSTNWGGWIRPQSKQACRKALTRPETAKGFRKQSGQQIYFSSSTNNQPYNLTHSCSTSGINRLSKNNTNNIFGLKKRSKRTQKQLQLNNQSHEHQYGQFKQIEIVINRRNFNKKSTQSLHRNKFQTNLDDQFLELFAD